MRMSKELMGNLGDLKKVFKNKMKTMPVHIPGGIFPSTADAEDIDLISYSAGEVKLEFEAPNVFKASHTNVNFKFQVTVKDAGKTGTVTADVVGLNSVFGMAISSKEGSFQFEKTACELNVGSVKLTVKGFGAEKDKEYTKKAQDFSDAMVARIGDVFCPQVDMFTAMANMYLMEYGCGPFFEEIGISLCLTESPKATTDYMEFAFSGAIYPVVKSPNGVPADYMPAPLVMSDDGVSKMLYLWEAEAMHNYMWKTLFETGKLVFKVSKESHPEFAAKIKKRLIKCVKDFGKTVSGNAEIKTTFKAEEAPVMTLSAANPKEILGKLKLRMIHDINDGGVESTFSVLFDIQAKLGFDVKPAKKGKMLPTFSAKVAIDKLTIEEVSEDAPPDVKVEHAKKAKKELLKGINNLLKKLSDKWNKLENSIEDKYKIVQVTAFDINALDKTLESSGSVKFDVVKISELQKEIIGKRLN
jgi:hypothetical protein